tara:strand:- start:140 stop:820 length:681 start_codon:yes stop_codon:yes gene_type:complete
MGKSIQVIHRDIIYKSKKDFKEYANELIYKKIGICENIKSNIYYDELLDLLKRHPNYKTKTEYMINLAIRRGQLNKSSLAVWIIQSDNKPDEDISWAKNCINSKNNSKQSELNSALRSSIQQQIMSFKNNTLHKCVNCNINADHVDHINHFELLTDMFLKKYNKNLIPSDFDNMTDSSGRRCFKPKDSIFEKEWQKFHKDNAKLRILCQKCNLTRPKFKNSDSKLI